MEQYLLFLLMSFLLIILPGPDTGLLIQNTVANGKRSGIHTTLGSATGLLIHTLAVVFGLSAIIVKSAFVFSIFKFIGALYLIYLGFISLKTLYMNTKKREEVLVEPPVNRKSKSSYLQGFLTTITNPKVAVFFLTFLPQFVQPGENHFIQLFSMGMIYAILTVFWFLIYVYLIHFFISFMKKQSVQNVIQGASGIVLLGFGIKLALEKQP